ncbi:MAG: transposase family protein [Deltaproteobacteria bacterium]|nr:transposase family protein [Deltaproteobacteria bacterium]
MDDATAPARLRWARLRFAIVGPLLASPPEPGELADRIAELARMQWKHPSTGEGFRYSAKSIERMYYAVRKSQNPIRVLERKVHARAGTHPSVPAALAAAIEKQYGDHPGWTYQLHFDNLVVLAKRDPAMVPMPGYATVRRFMKDHGWLRAKKPRGRKGGTGELVARETRSYEVPHVNALWHYDFHEGKRNVLTASGEYKKPYLFGLLDDCSRLCCHAQWYTDRENTEDLIHGLCQGFQKRKLPRSTMSDNGGPMIAAETIQGCSRLSILQHLTLPRSPEQNGKQEHFWTQVEQRLMAMLEGEPVLTLELLNTATQAWVEQEYHQTIHSELGKTPLQRYLEGPDVGRPCPDSQALRRAFRMELTRTQRLTDGTVTVAGVRFEVPSAYRTLRQVRLRVARWDLSSVELVDPRKGSHLATLLPLDKVKNANGARRVLAPAASPPRPASKPPGIAPLLRELMAEYAATGLPPAYLPKDNPADSTEEE